MQPGSVPPVAGYRVEYFDSLGSTNDEAMARGRAGDPGRLWIVAHEQSAGRGRMARPWSSPRGNLHASVLLSNEAEPASAPQLGFVAGVALARAVNELLPQDKRCHIKWPNDILFDGAKLAGLLLEGSTLPDGGFVCVAGFGVNCAHHPEDTPYPATHLMAHAPLASAQALFSALARQFAETLQIWDRGENFDAIRAAWLEQALPQGSPMRVRAADGSGIDGRFVTIDATGRLVLDTGSRHITFDAGDVFPIGPGTFIAHGERAGAQT